jgi:hypothetical protein
MYIEYLDHIPQVPRELIDPIEFIIDSAPKQKTPIDENYKGFQTRRPNWDLIHWLCSQFSFPVRCQYQIVSPILPIHKDKGRTVAYNYLLSTGGTNVSTKIYEDDETFKVLQSEIIPVNRWHRLDVSMFHGVHGLEKNVLPRIAISCVPADKNLITYKVDGRLSC